MSWRATASRTCAPAISRAPTSGRTSRARARSSKISAAWACAATAPPASRSARAICGHSNASPRPATRIARACTPCSTITTACRMLRGSHIARTTGCSSCRSRPRAYFHETCRPVAADISGCLPYRASRWAIERVNRDRPPTRDLLLPSVGDRPAPAPHRWGQRQDPLPPLPESRPHRIAAGPASVRLPLGPHRPRVRDRRGVKPLDLPVDAQSTPSVRPFREGDRQAWADFVERCARRRFSTASSGTT